MKYTSQLSLAVLAPPQLGDGMLWAYFAHNLALQGYQTTLFHNTLYKARNWFPNIEIERLPGLNNAAQVWSTYDFLMHIECPEISYHYPLEFFESFGDKHICLTNSPVNYRYYSHFARSLHFDNPLLNRLANYQHLNFPAAFPQCQSVVERVDAYLNASGITQLDRHFCRPPSPLQHRQYNKRVVLAPTSSFVKKNWSPKKFLRLADKLKAAGWDPHFVLSPYDDVKFFQRLIGDCHSCHVLGLSQLFTFIYQSAFFIGNDSGPGHIASALNVPTLTLFPKGKKKGALLWLPDFYSGAYSISKWPKLPNWCRTHRASTLTSSAVLADFARLVGRANANT